MSPPEHETKPEPYPVHGVADARWGGWTWRAPARGEHFRRCSYCGSMHPDDVADEFASGVTADWADQKYGWPHKFYVRVPNRTPDAVFCVGASHGGDPSRDPGPGYVHVSQLTAAQRIIALRDGMLDENDARDGARWYTFGTREHHAGKFYTIHLADPAVSDRARAAIERVGGLRFHFKDGRIRWEPVGGVKSS